MRSQHQEPRFGRIGAGVGGDRDDVLELKAFPLALLDQPVQAHKIGHCFDSKNEALRVNKVLTDA